MTKLLIVFAVQRECLALLSGISMRITTGKDYSLSVTIKGPYQERDKHYDKCNTLPTIR